MAPTPRRTVGGQWERWGKSTPEPSALLYVTQAEDGRVSDVRTRCHIDVEGMPPDMFHPHRKAVFVQVQNWHKTCFLHAVGAHRAGATEEEPLSALHIIVAGDTQ